MASGFHTRILVPSILLMTVLLTLSGCTIVRHDEESERDDESELTFYFQDGSFDAAAYVADIWDDKVVPAFTDASSPAAEVLNALDADLAAGSESYGRKAEVESPYSFRISGSGVVIAANTDSAASTIELSLDGYSGDRTVLLQIGPVIKKSAVRDSLGFISFGDFTNQLEYAGVSKELNFKVRDDVVSLLDRDDLEGKRINFSGAFILFPEEPILITPVVLESGGSDG